MTVNGVRMAFIVGSGETENRWAHYRQNVCSIHATERHSKQNNGNHWNKNECGTLLILCIELRLVWFGLATIETIQTHTHLAHSERERYTYRKSRIMPTIGKSAVKIHAEWIIISSSQRFTNKIKLFTQNWINRSVSIQKYAIPKVYTWCYKWLSIATNEFEMLVNEKIWSWFS